MSELKKRPRGSGWMNPEDGLDVADADRRRILQDVMERSPLFNKKIGRPYKYTAAEVEQRIQDYFAACVEKGSRCTLMGLANALDITYSVFLDWTRDRSKPYYETINKARQLIAEFEELMVLNGYTNVIYGIFRDKTRFGYREASEIVLTPNNPGPLGETPTPEDMEAIRQRYLDSVPDDDE